MQVTSIARCAALALALPALTFAQGPPQPLEAQEDPIVAGTSATFEVLFDPTGHLPTLPSTTNTLADDASNFVLTRDGVVDPGFGVQGAYQTPAGSALLVGYWVQVTNYDARAKYVITPAIAHTAVLGPAVTLQEASEPELPAPDGPEEGWRLIDSESLRIDARTVETEAGELGLGLDFDLTLRKESSEDTGFEFSSRGFVSQPDISGASDSIVSELRYYSWRVGEPRTHDQPIIVDGRIDPRWLKSDTLDSWSLKADVHIKHEASQDFDGGTLTGGVGLSFDLRWPRLFGGTVPLPVLPFAPLLLADRSDLTSGIPQPAFGFDLDYALSSHGTARDEVEEDDDFVRAALEMSWRAEALRRDTWVYFRGGVWVELDPSDEVEDADLDRNDFMEVGLELPLGERGGERYFVISYRDGALPPNYGDGNQFSIGLSWGF